MSARTLNGTVTSNSMVKTIVVSVEMSKKHSRYNKRYVNHTKFKAHTDEKIELGTVVTISETAPISRGKNWKVVKVHSAKALEVKQK